MSIAPANLEVRLSTGLKPAVQERISNTDIESGLPVLMKQHSPDLFAGQPHGTPRVNLRNRQRRASVTANHGIPRATLRSGDARRQTLESHRKIRGRLMPALF